MGICLHPGMVTVTSVNPEVETQRVRVAPLLLGSMHMEEVAQDH